MRRKDEMEEKGKRLQATADSKVVSLTALYQKLNAGGKLTKRELEVLRGAHPSAAAEALAGKPSQQQVPRRRNRR